MMKVRVSRFVFYHFKAAMTCIVRGLFLIVFSLFWGGLTFYTGFVVRVNHDLLNDSMMGGLITQRVTEILQVLGAVTVVLMVLQAILVLRKAPRLGALLVFLSMLVAVSIGNLFVVHRQLDSVIDKLGHEVTDYAKFEVGHRRYNQWTTVEWGGSLVYLSVVVFSWRKVDLLEQVANEKHQG